MVAPEPTPVVLVIGSVPGEPPHTMEVYLTQEQADQHILQGLLGAFGNHLRAVEPGGTVSLIVTRAPDQPGEGSPRFTTGSFVINNEKGDRHVWDFHTIACEAQP